MSQPIQVSCVRCHAPAEPEARFCSVCGQPLQVQPTVQLARPQSVQPHPIHAQLAWQGPPPTPAQVVLRVFMPATWHLIDTNVDVFLDGQYIGRGSFNRGIELQTTTTPGSHTLELGADVLNVGVTIISAFSTSAFRKTWKLPLAMAGLGERVATLRYSRAWGNFKLQVS